MAATSDNNPENGLDDISHKISHVSINPESSSISELKSNEQPKILSTEAIYLFGDNQEKLFTAEKKLIVPPNSPKRIFIIKKQLENLSKIYFEDDVIQIPYVRVIGIRKCISVLGKIFGCSFYGTNPLQFWFLNILTDCLWRCQDEFILTDEHQKIVLKWILFIFDLIRDPSLNLSRHDFFTLFHEAITIAENQIDAGIVAMPPPEELFFIKQLEDSPRERDDSFSSLTDTTLPIEDDESERSYLIIPSEEYPELPNFYELFLRECRCDISVYSSIETISEKSVLSEERNDEDLEEKIEDTDKGSFEKITDYEVDDSYKHNNSIDLLTPVIPNLQDFYQPNLRIHSRFLHITDDEEEKEVIDVSKEEAESDPEYEWVNEQEMQPIKSQFEKTKSVLTTSQDISVSSPKKLKSNIIKSKSKNDKKATLESSSIIQVNNFKKSKPKILAEERKPSEEETLKAWIQYNKLQLKIKDMADPSKGWLPTLPTLCDEECTCDEAKFDPEKLRDPEYVEIKKQWLLYLDKHKNLIEQNAKNKFINSCLLLIIKQFIFDYFYESFQYKIIKLSFQMAPNLIIEQLNGEWQIPKICREEFKRPAEKKPKPEKPAKEKKPKPSKEKKKDKKSKKSQSTKSTKTSSKKEKKQKKEDKPHKLTKDEKEELERLQQEELKALEAKIAAEENKRLIFPLNLASIDERFFTDIFGEIVGDSKKKQTNKKNKKKKL